MRVYTLLWVVFKMMDVVVFGWYGCHEVGCWSGMVNVCTSSLAAILSQWMDCRVVL